MANQGVEVDLPIIQNSSLHGIEIRKAVIRSSNLNYIRIHGSTISESTLKKCKLFNCIIRNCSLTESDVHETKIHSSSMDGCNVTTSPLALRKFPPEIREMIFQRCIDTKDNKERDNKSPPIIVSLRCDKELYQEAIEVFYKLNFFRLTFATAPSCKLLSAKAIGSVKKLILSERGLRLGEQLSQIFQGSIESLWFAKGYGPEFLGWVRKYLADMSKLKELYFTFKSFKTDCGFHQIRRVEGVIELANHHFGTKGLPTRVNVGSEKAEVWLWKAHKGETLKWID